MIIRNMFALVFLFVATAVAAAKKETKMEFGTAANARVSALLEQHSSRIEHLKKEASEKVPDMTHEPFCNDVFYLRYCLNHDSDQECLENFVNSLEWRLKEGREICKAAREAALEATEGGQWDYHHVHKRIPNSIIRKFMTPSKYLTIFSRHGDPVLCIKHGEIQDKALMKSLDSPDHVVDFMLYAKEVNHIVANRRSLESDRLHYILAANCMDGASLATGDKKFRNALKDSAKLADRLYPTITGPTLMLNLPNWLTSVAKTFAPSGHSMTFAQGPLKSVNQLTDIATDGPERQEFLSHLDELVYNDLPAYANGQKTMDYSVQ